MADKVVSPSLGSTGDGRAGQTQHQQKETSAHAKQINGRGISYRRALPIATSKLSIGPARTASVLARPFLGCVVVTQRELTTNLCRRAVIISAKWRFDTGQRVWHRHETNSSQPAHGFAAYCEVLISCGRTLLVLNPFGSPFSIQGQHLHIPRDIRFLGQVAF